MGPLAALQHGLCSAVAQVDSGILLTVSIRTLLLVSYPAILALGVSQLRRVWIDRRDRASPLMGSVIRLWLVKTGLALAWLVACEWAGIWRHGILSHEPLPVRLPRVTDVSVFDVVIAMIVASVPGPYRLWPSWSDLRSMCSWSRRSRLK